MPELSPPTTPNDLHHDLREVASNLARISGQLDVWTPVWTTMGHGLTDLQNRITKMETTISEQQRSISDMREEVSSDKKQRSSNDKEVRASRLQVNVAIVAAVLGPIITVLLDRILNHRGP